MTYTYQQLLGDDILSDDSSSDFDQIESDSDIDIEEDQLIDQIDIDQIVDDQGKYCFLCQYHDYSQICDHCVNQYVKYLEYNEQNHMDFIDDTNMDYDIQIE